MASPQTIYSESTDGRVQSANTVYATARTGGTLDLDAGTTYCYVGQIYIDPNYYTQEIFMNFNTGAVIPDDATVTLATLSLYLSNDASTTDFTTNVYIHDWGDTLATGDWVSGADLAAKTKVATFASAGIGAGYNDFTNVAFPANVSKTGFTRLLLASDRLEAGNTPDGAERIRWCTSEYADTARDPKLYVEYTEAAAGCPRQVMSYYQQ